MTKDEQIQLLVRALCQYSGEVSELGNDVTTLLQELEVSENDFSGYVESDLPELQAAFVLVHLKSAQQKQRLADLLAIADRIRNNRYAGPYAEAESIIDEIKLRSSLSEDFDFELLYDQSIQIDNLKRMFEQHQV